LRGCQKFSSRCHRSVDLCGTDQDDRATNPLNRLKEGLTMRAISQPRLRLFDPDNQATTIAPKQKKVRLAEILNVLSEATRSDRAWLSDFADDEVRISSDLYEVLTTYRRLRPSA
jgi:hypothetical protein